jgi:hypothetical protein
VAQSYGWPFLLPLTVVVYLDPELFLTFGTYRPAEFHDASIGDLPGQEIFQPKCHRPRVCPGRDGISAVAVDDHDTEGRPPLAKQGQEEETAANGSYSRLHGRLPLPNRWSRLGTVRTSHAVHWMVPIVGLVLFAWGNITVFISCILYKVDTYMAVNGASAMAANDLLRYISGAVFPLFTVQIYNGMGFHWASSLLGFVTLALLPVPWVLFGSPLDCCLAYFNLLLTTLTQRIRMVGRRCFRLPRVGITPPSSCYVILARLTLT